MGWILLIVVVFFVVVVPFLIYNRCVHLKNMVRESWRDIDTELQRRYDLVPNLVNTVKGYAAHESSVLESVTTLRTDAMAAPRSPDAQAPVQQALGQGIGQLFAVAERYPDLKASSEFLALQRELVDTEDRIQVSRRIYNANVRGVRHARADVPVDADRPALRVRGRAVLRHRSGGAGGRAALGRLVRSVVDKYNTSRALPRPRRRPARPHRGPRPRAGWGAGRRVGAGPGVRHEPGDRAPGARRAAPGGARDGAPGRGLVRRVRSGSSAAGSRDHGRGRGRGRGRAAEPAHPRVRVRRRRRADREGARGLDPEPMCSASSA